MSVHGEYSRSLENLIAALQPLEDTQGRSWQKSLESARLDSQPDLSAAARAAEQAAAAIAPSPPAPHVEALRDHLLALCASVLGRPRPDCPSPAD